MKFERLFWAFKPCINAIPFCKPILKINGTFLYCKYKHNLLIATTQDENYKALPIAFAIVEAKNTSSYPWFLRMLWQHVINLDAPYLIFTWHDGIMVVVTDESLGWQPHWGHHWFCIQHIISNFNTTFKNATLKREVTKMGNLTILM